MTLVTRHLCGAKDLGLNGNLYGGNMMSWMDEAAYLYVRSLYPDETWVTRAFTDVEFLRPVKCGQAVVIRGTVMRIGTTSATLKLFASVDEVEVCTMQATFVAVDQNGNKKAID